ncbi:CIA30 family protein [Pseudomarimonas salicorniae]|uniref:CIA30 family protein n=1 Tax=Pseudomarimonas salicorniae TaxID=2933270 RepID=A0ABT0GHE8_9GAMM|nr:CIA30 family protein [Lysobacter sp. CAU 1642]
MAESGAVERLPAVEFDWAVVNDGVMGGLSRSAVAERDGLLQFRGVLSLENNGGFASIRSRGLAGLDLAGSGALQLRVRGDGRRYQLRAYGSARYRGREVAYVAEFDAPADVWHEVSIDIGSMQPRFRGMALEGPALEASDINGLGLLIADKLEGPFALEVDWIGRGP